MIFNDIKKILTAEFINDITEGLPFFASGSFASFDDIPLLSFCLEHEKYGNNLVNIGESLDLSKTITVTFTYYHEFDDLVKDSNEFMKNLEIGILNHPTLRLIFITNDYKFVRYVTPLEENRKGWE